MSEQSGPPRDTSWWAEASAPRQVENGIKARSKRGAIGEQWWSRRFVEVLESFGMSGRLARGRNYARRGQVMEFELGTGKVRARVQGSRPAPYQVRIGVMPLTTAQWRSVTEALGAQALFRAKLLAGQMPHEIEDVFAACGTPLFPRSARDLEMSCSCPDWGVPCKHLAAVCYVLAEKFDDDPFAMLAWRGRGREALLGALRRRPVAHDPGPAGATGPEPDPLRKISAAPLAGSLDRFWSPGLTRGRLRAAQAVPATVPDLVLRSFEPPGAEIRGRDLTALLTPAYLRLAGQEELTGEGQDIAGGDEDDPEAQEARGAEQVTAGEAEQVTAREAE
jgi:uncharacterized Zn finger protein